MIKVMTFGPLPGPKDQEGSSSSYQCEHQSSGRRGRRLSGTSGKYIKWDNTAISSSKSSSSPAKICHSHLTSRVLTQRNLQVASPLGHPSRHLRRPKHRTTASQFERWQNLKTSTMRPLRRLGVYPDPITTVFRLLPRAHPISHATGEVEVLPAFVRPRIVNNTFRLSRILETRLYSNSPRPITRISHLVNWNRKNHFKITSGVASRSGP